MFILIAACLDKSHIWENFGSGDMGRSALGQWDCKIFKLTLSPEQNDKKSLFLHVDTNSLQLKVDWKILGWTWSFRHVPILVEGLKI